jgi:hypothetical protein
MLIRKISTSSVMLEYKFIEKFDIGIMIVSQYSVWLRAARPGDTGSIPGTGERIFSCSLCVQTGSEAHSDSCTMVPGSFPRG